MKFLRCCIKFVQADNSSETEQVTVQYGF